MSYIRHTIKRPSGNPGVGLRPRDLLVLIDIDDIAYMPGPDANGVVIAEDIILKPGAYGIGLYMTPGTAELTSAADGDTDAVGFTPSLKFTHPGNTREIREFKASAVNSRFIGIMRYCSGEPSDLIGTICNPCKLTPSYTGSSDANSNEFTLEQISKGDDVFIYEGAIPLEEPVAVVSAGSDGVTYVADGIYQVEKDCAAITSVTGGKAGSLVALTGAPGAAVDLTATDGKILLREGAAFVLSEGTQITLRAYNSGSGLVWVEQSRHTS